MFFRSRSFCWAATSCKGRASWVVFTPSYIDNISFVSLFCALLGSSDRFFKAEGLAKASQKLSLLSFRFYSWFSFLLLTSVFSSQSVCCPGPLLKNTTASLHPLQCTFVIFSSPSLGGWGQQKNSQKHDYKLCVWNLVQRIDKSRCDMACMFRDKVLGSLARADFIRDGGEPA